MSKNLKVDYILPGRTIFDLSQNELGFIYRLGECYDLKIKRESMLRKNTLAAQYTGLSVWINNKHYIIEQIYPIEENKKEVLIANKEDRLPNIIVYYNIGCFDSLRSKYNF